MRHSALTCSINLPSIIKIFQTVAELCSEKENEVFNMNQGAYIENEDKQSCHSCKQHSALACSITISCIIKIFRMVQVLMVQPGL